MASSRLTAGLSLGRFLTALHTRLDALSREDLRSVLVAHAEHLPVGERQRFLDVFPDPGGRLPKADGQPETSLLADIDAFAALLAEGDQDEAEAWEADGYHDGWYDEDPDPSWVPEADALFAATGEMFVSGRLDVAREAYARLLALFGPVGDHTWSSLEIWRLETTDTAETMARYLRAVYETTAPQDRAAAVHQAYLTLPWSTKEPALDDIATTRQEGLPDLASFLPGWIDRLLTETSQPSPETRVRLLTEAALRQGGVEALADLARRSGPHQGGVALARIDALTTAGRPDEAAAAAREALDLLGGDSRHLAAIADRLADLTTRLGDTAAAVRARRRAWRAEPSRRRLLAMAGSGLAAGVAHATLDAEADDVAATDRLSCELMLLAGRLDGAITALTQSAALGWRRSSHPGPVVLPFLWAAATGTPPEPDQGHLGRAFAALDEDPDATYRGHVWDAADDEPSLTADPPQAGEGSLAALLGQVILDRPGSPADRDRWICIAATVVHARIDAIVSDKHRSAYARAAGLAYAHAEALVAMDKGSQAQAFLGGVRAAYPRHVAFRRELDTASRTSTLSARRPVRVRP